MKLDEFETALVDTIAIYSALLQLKSEGLITEKGFAEHLQIFTQEQRDITDYFETKQALIYKDIESRISNNQK